MLPRRVPQEKMMHAVGLSAVLVALCTTRGLRAMFAARERHAPADGCTAWLAKMAPSPTVDMGGGQDARVDDLITRVITINKPHLRRRWRE